MHKQQATRVVWIDIFKGIGILLVVIGHILAEQKNCPPLYNIIYMFHMPLFFFISGYLYKQKSNIKLHIKGKVIQLLIPYTFILLLFIPFNGLSTFLSEPITTKSVLTYITHLLTGGRNFGGATGAFWFITCLFFVQTIYNFISVKFNSRNVHLIVFTFLLLSYINSVFYPSFWLPGDANVALFALPIYHIGHLLHKREKDIISKPIIMIIFAVLAIASVFLLPENRMDMKNNMYGIPVITLLSSIIMIFFMMYISQKIATIKVISSILSEMGKASLVIMYFHLLFIAILSRFMISDIYLVIPLVTILSYIIYYFTNKWRISRILILGSKSDYYSRMKK